MERQAIQEEMTREMEQLGAKIESADAKVQAAEDVQAQNSAEQGQQHQAELESLRQRMDAGEQADSELRAETQALRELCDQRHADQEKINVDVQTKQEATGQEMESVSKKIEEADANGKAGAEFEEQQLKNVAEIAALQAQVGTFTKALETTSQGLSDQMGHLVQSTAECLGKVEECESKEVVSKLSARLEGGFDAIIVRMEADKYMRENVDKIADNVANSFLRLLDDSSQKITARVDKLEHRMAAG